MGGAAPLRARLSRVAPYIVVLVVVGVLFYFAGRIDFVAPGGRIGPDFWPKLILSLAMLTCVYEIVKNLFFAGSEGDLEGVLAAVQRATALETPLETAQGTPLDVGLEVPEKNYPHLLAIGIAMTIAYAVLIDKLGFFLCTLLYMAVFMWVGRYRRIGVILSVSLVGTLAFMFTFMRLVYVSLPLGVAPFSEVSFFLMRLMGIR